MGRRTGDEGRVISEIVFGCLGLAQNVFGFLNFLCFFSDGDLHFPCDLRPRSFNFLVGEAEQFQHFVNIATCLEQCVNIVNEDEIKAPPVEQVKTR